MKLPLDNLHFSIKPIFLGEQCVMNVRIKDTLKCKTDQWILLSEYKIFIDMVSGFTLHLCVQKQPPTEF